ncbi:hypothetical protein NFI96_021609, partial [Prochilodus magdalenae]
MAGTGDDVITGESFSGSTIDQISYGIGTKRNVTIEIANYSKTYILTNPKFYTSSGRCVHPPPPVIAKNTKEVCSFSKHEFSVGGAVGVLMYQMVTKKKDSVGDLAVMFSVPFEHTIFKNWFALGIYTG